MRQLGEYGIMVVGDAVANGSAEIIEKTVAHLAVVDNAARHDGKIREQIITAAREEFFLDRRLSPGTGNHAGHSLQGK